MHARSVSPVHRLPFRPTALLPVTGLGLAALLAAWPTTAVSQARPAVAPAQQVYYPAAGDAWERRTPAQVGMNAERLQAAIATARESTAPRDLLEAHWASGFGREPIPEPLGPFRVRGDPAVLVVRHGYIVAESGDPQRVEPTFSVTKSFVTTTVGLAYDRDMIRDVQDHVRDYFPPVIALKGSPGPGGAPVTTAMAAPIVSGAATPATGNGRAAGAATRATESAFEVLTPFDSEHNAKIRWDHLLRQTSEWQGTLWSKPDWSDRPRGDVEAWRTRPRPEPGAAFTYNDVRVNLMALASLNVWRRPLPDVLKELVMDPIGASSTWRWLGYDNSWVVMDGKLVQSVAGGAHWGGGMWISARDMARFGYLTLRRGKWGDKQILSDEWVTMALTPTSVGGGYGFANWTVRGPQPSPFYHAGNGPNIIYVDPVNDLVIVTRWISNWNAVVTGITAAIEKPVGGN
jgi:CubicO group peptidase (beta-lactamase class C family)